MSKLLWEVKTLICDICKERPMITTIEVSRGNWKGVCAECNISKKKDKTNE